MDQEKAKAVKERLDRFKGLWPDVTTEKGISDAVKGGAVASGYSAVSYALSLVFLLTGSASMSGLDGGGTVIMAFVINAVLTAVACGLPLPACEA